MSSQVFNSDDLQRFIDQHHIQAEILAMAEHTPTVPDAARALGVGPEQIIKSLVFTVGEEPLLVINNGTAKVDQRRLAGVLGVGRKRVKFAGADQALALTGYVVGSMPPFGHKQKLRTLVDVAVTELAEIFGGGGVIDAMLALTPAELLRVTEAEVVQVSE
jgi:Cys-tRNA(Pro) deacylase